MSSDLKFKEENRRLELSLREIRGQLAEIGPRYTGNDYTEQVLDDLRQERKQRLTVADREPYFGRLDFQEQGSDRRVPLYIGKAGVIDSATQQPLVVDWRAPVSSLFYSFAGGSPDVSYESPDGVVEGVISLKRNLLVRQSALQRVVDSYAEGQDNGPEGAVTDEFLLHRLSESKDNKLRDIVSTIQQEQDAIIRTDKNKALFIQGVAGSGKTTVALHRLAYLLYRYQDKVRAERMMILAPNRMFLDYISGVLPELGVGDIRQTTFAEWAAELLGGTVAPMRSADALERWFERKATEREKEEGAARRKGSQDFVRQVDEALERFERELIPDESFSPEPGLRLEASRIRDWFREEPPEEPVMKRRERLLNRLKRWMEIQLGKQRWGDKTIKARATANWKAYAEKMPAVTAAQFYASAFPEAFKLPKGASKRKPVQVEAEDLAVLALVQLKLYGAEEAMYDHIVIDEAQDYSPMQLAALKRRQRSVSMTILGDLQQGIHDYAGVRRWSELTALFAPEETAYYELDRSYRSTTEIIEFANRVLAGMDGGVKPAVPVFRSGDPVETAAVGEAELADAVAATLRDWRQRPELDTVAVLCRTAAASERLHRELAARGVEAALLTADQQAYGGGLTVVPVYLSKGLEFDAVLIPDADEDAYGPDDAKLLYVGCTRALHRLKLLYQSQLTPLIVV